MFSCKEVTVGGQSEWQLSVCGVASSKLQAV